jgi:Tfp pilus assembly protein PilO
VSRFTRTLIVAVVALGAVFGYWKFELAPKRAESAELAQKIATQEAQLVQTQSLIATYQGARDAYQDNYAKVVRLGKAVPSDDDSRSLVVQLDAAAKRSGVDFDTLDISGGASAAGAASSSAKVIPGAVNAGAFSAMPFSFSFSGDFATLGNFFSRLERFVSLKGDEIAVSGRLMRVERIALTPSPGGWPGLSAQVGASTYIVSQAQPVAATPAAGGTTTSTTTDPSTTTAATSGSGSQIR